MPLPRRRREPHQYPAADYERHNALVAAGYRVRKQQADALRRVAMPWQRRAFQYYDLLGPIKYGAQFYSRMLSPLELYAAETVVDDDGRTQLETSKNPTAVKLLERIQDPGGGRSNLLGTYGRLMFLNGEAQLFVTKDPESGMEQWEMLSRDELKLEGNVYMRFRAPSLPVEEYREPGDDDYEPINDREAVAYRLWRKHPQFSEQADATMQGALDTCEELVMLNQAVRARLTSRLAGAGILLIDERITLPPLEPVGDEDPEEDPFIARLTEAMTTAIVDQGSADAIVPIVVRANPGEGQKVADMMHLLTIVDSVQMYPETGLRREGIERLGIELDMPPEALTGKSSANHWSGWLIGADEWKSHGQPLAQALCDDLTAAYFRPALKAAGVRDWWLYSIAYDESAVVVHPDRTTDAKDLFDREAISKKALREAAHYDEDDAMPPDELQERLGLKLRDANMVVSGTPSSAPSDGSSEPAAAPDATTEDTTSAPDDTQPSEVEQRPPTPPNERPDRGQPDLRAASNGHASVEVAKVLGATDLALLRARQAAGNRLCSLAKRDREVAAMVRDVPIDQVAHVLGADRVRQLGGIERDLVAPAADLVSESLRMFGVTDEDTIRLVTEQFSAHAARTLYAERPVPLPPQFVNYLHGLSLTLA